MTKWYSHKIEDICTVLPGGTPKTSIEEYWGGDIPWITPKDLSNHSSKHITRGERSITKDGLKHSSTKLAPQGSVLLSTRAPIGYTAISTQKATTNQGMKSLVPNNNTTSDFLYYLLNYNVTKMENIASGSTFKEISTKDVKNFSICIPGILEQKAIANILSSLDDKIELNNNINQRLEELAQTLYNRWFVDFEFPNDNDEPYKSSGGEMVGSELGMIPKGWEITSLTNIADFQNGLAVKKYATSETKQSLPVLKIKELRNRDCDENSDRVSLDFPEGYIIKKGDLIFSWSGTLIVDFWTGKSAALNQHLFKVSSANYDNWFIYFAIDKHLDKFRNYASSMATTMGHIKKSDLKQAKTLIPNSKIYKKAKNLIQPIIQKIIQNRIENRKLSTIRDTLLPKLMNGEIEVPIEE